VNAIAPAYGCEGDGIQFDVAVTRVLGLVAERVGVEEVPLTACAGRVIAAPWEARLGLPRFDQSAMDGYAVCRADLRPSSWLAITGRTAAGEAPGCLHPNSAHRILTGAPLPLGADTVIAQENVSRQGTRLRIEVTPPVGANIRCQSEDIRAGQRLIAEGTRLDWRHVAVLAAQGVSSVMVRRRPRVTLLSTGRELQEASHSLAPGQIHDSNLPMLAALLQADGAIVRPFTAVIDEAEATRAALLDAAIGADLVLTTAGISVGDEDHVRDALLDLGGDLAVLKVAMKPGKPLAAGRLRDAIFIGLPGNPLAALAGAIAFARPLLARMTGGGEPGTARAYAGFHMCRKAGRAEFVPVHLHQKGACLWAERTGPDGSGRLAPLLGATGLAFVPAWTGAVRYSDEIEVVPFEPSMIASRWLNIHE
jgi:molybdopterin molybdotransferase